MEEVGNVGEKLANAFGLVIGLATVAVIFKSKNTRGVIGAGGSAIARVITAAQHG